MDGHVKLLEECLASVLQSSVPRGTFVMPRCPQRQLLWYCHSSFKTSSLIALSSKPNPSLGSSLKILLTEKLCLQTCPALALCFYSEKSALTFQTALQAWFAHATSSCYLPQFLDVYIAKAYCSNTFIGIYLNLKTMTERYEKPLNKLSRVCFALKSYHLKHCNILIGYTTLQCWLFLT